MFELSISSYVAGAVMVSFTLCVWLSCGAYFICCRTCEGCKEMCIGVVTGCGVMAAFCFIIAFGFNASAIGMVIDTQLNSTLHDSDCLSPYWLAYIPPFGSGAVFLAFLCSLCCCLICRCCFHSLYNDSTYRPLRQ